jgi:hypothetical protein
MHPHKRRVNASGGLPSVDNPPFFFPLPDFAAQKNLDKYGFVRLKG